MTAAKRENGHEEVPVVLQPGDTAIVKAVNIAGQLVEFSEPLRVPVERLHECQLILGGIERGASGSAEEGRA